MGIAEAKELAQKLRADGLSYRAISEKLAEAGYTTTTGKAISPGNINRWLNPNKPKSKKPTRAKGVQARIPEPVSEPTPGERIERLQAAHQGALAEVDRLTGELSDALGEVDTLKARLSRAEEGGKSKMDAIQKAITEAIAPLQAEVAALKERYESFLRVNKPRTQSPVHCLGWNVQKSGKYFKAYRKVNGQVRGVHIGPEYDPETAREKITGAIQRNGAKWGLSPAEIESLMAGNAPEPSPVRGDQADHQDKQELIKSLITRHGGQSGTAPIWRVRRAYEAAGHGDFDATLTQLAGGYKIELLNGDPGETPDAELKRNPESEIGLPYINLQWTGGE